MASGGMEEAIVKALVTEGREVARDLFRIVMTYRLGSL